jgi:hypothetical protein
MQKLWCTWMDELGVFGRDVGFARHGAGFLRDGGREGVGGVAVGEAVHFGFRVVVHIAFCVAVGVRHFCGHVGGSGGGH